MDLNPEPLCKAALITTKPLGLQRVYSVLYLGGYNQ